MLGDGIEVDAEDDREEDDQEDIDRADDQGHQRHGEKHPAERKAPPAPAPPEPSVAAPLVPLFDHLGVVHFTAAAVELLGPRAARGRASPSAP